MVVIHNGQVEAIQPIEEIKDKFLKNFEILKSGKLGGTHFVGTIAEFEVFGRAVPQNELLQWTDCQIKGVILSLLFIFSFLYTDTVNNTWLFIRIL